MNNCGSAFLGFADRLARKIKKIIRGAIGREIRKHDFYSIYFKNQDIMAILFRKHERLSNLAQNSVKRYILQLYINTAIRQD